MTVFAKGWATAFLLRLLTSKEREEGRPGRAQVLAFQAERVLLD